MSPPSNSRGSNRPPSPSPSPDTSRRRFLGGVAGAVAGTTAGCATPDRAFRSGMATFPDGSWPMAGGDPANTSAVSGPLPADATESWRASVGGWRWTVPVVDGTRVLVVTDDTARARRASDGRSEWEHRLRRASGDPIEVAGNAAVDDVTGSLVVPAYDGGREPASSLHALDGATGDRRWRLSLDGERPYSVRVAGGTAYLRTSAACLAVDVADGSVTWRRGGLEPLQYEEYNISELYGAAVAPTVAGDTVYVADRNRLLALDRATGERRWERRVPYCLSSPAVGERGVYVRSYVGETLALRRDGEVRWRAPVGGLASPALHDGTVVVTDGDVVALDAESGEERWRWDLRTDVIGATPLAFDDGVVALGTRSAALHDERPFFGLGSRVAWTLPDQIQDIVSPAVGAGGLYAIDPFSNELVAFT